MTTEHIPPNGPGQFAAWKRDIERQLANLSRSRNLNNAAFTGRMRGTDENGTDRIYLGELGDGFGIEVRDEDGTAVFRVDEGGMRRPALNLPYRRVQDPIEVATTSWVRTWETGIGSRTHPALRWTSLLTANASTTFEARLRLAGVGGEIFTSPQTVPAETAVTYTWNWAPGWPLGSGGISLIQLEMRRTAGSDSGFAYAPDRLLMGTVDDLGATSTGV